MIRIDANILIYAVSRDLPLHEPARRWLEAVLSSDTRVGLPWIALLARLRITTRHGLWERPLEPERALA